MKELLKHKNLLKNVLLILIFVLLGLSIAKNLTEIYVFSLQDSAIRVPIIMYHQVKNSQFGKDVISPTEFENDLKFLKSNNYNTITMSDLIDYVYNDEELPNNPIILSFDDGYFNTYKYVFPLLKTYQMKIVLSIVGKSTDDFTRVHDENINYSHLSWDKINEMVESGLVEIQNHSYNMHKVCNGRYGCGQTKNESLAQYEQVLTEDVTKLQTQAMQMIGIIPNTFTYPYGKYSDNSEEILKKLGFKATLSCTYGVNLISKDPDKLFGLKRMCRVHNHKLSNLIKEGMETLKYTKD